MYVCVRALLKDCELPKEVATACHPFASRPQACYTITSVGYGDITPKNVVERSVCSAARQGRNFTPKLCLVDKTDKTGQKHKPCTCFSLSSQACGRVCITYTVHIQGL